MNNSKTGLSSVACSLAKPVHILLGQPLDKWLRATGTVLHKKELQTPEMREAY